MDKENPKCILGACRNAFWLVGPLKFMALGWMRDLQNAFLGAGKNAFCFGGILNLIICAAYSQWHNTFSQKQCQQCSLRVPVNVFKRFCVLWLAIGITAKCAQKNKSCKILAKTLARGRWRKPGRKRLIVWGATVPEFRPTPI